MMLMFACPGAASNGSVMHTLLGRGSPARLVCTRGDALHRVGKHDLSCLVRHCCLPLEPRGLLCAVSLSVYYSGPETWGCLGNSNYPGILASHRVSAHLPSYHLIYRIYNNNNNIVTMHACLTSFLSAYAYLGPVCNAVIAAQCLYCTLRYACPKPKKGGVSKLPEPFFFHPS
jgi:hypothetical protein